MPANSYKVLYCGVFNPKLIYQASPISNDDVICRGLEKNNCRVVRFDFRQEAKQFGVENMRQALYEKAISYQPDIIWFAKTDTIGVETLLNIKSSLPLTKFVNWTDDIRPEPVEEIIEFNKHTDLLLADFGGEWLKKHKELGVNRIANFFTLVDTENYNHIENVDAKWQEDIIFTGKDAPFSEDIRKTVKSSLEDYGAKIYDENEWLGYPEYKYAINGAYIGVGCNSLNHAELYTSDRLAHFMGCGTFYMTYRIKGLENIFSSNEIIQFDSIAQMYEQIEYYLMNDKEREEIAYNGYKKIRELFDYRRVVKDWLNILFNNKSEYDWVKIL